MNASARRSSPLPPPVVPPGAYSEEYYRRSCAGAEEWDSTEGRSFHGMYTGYATRFGIGPGDVMVDIGTGRGEMVVVAASRGATGIGVEYSDAALELATTSSRDREGRVGFVAADARVLPLRDDTADHVTMLDVVEHLTADELAISLREANRVLRSGGRLWIHTMPSSLIYNVTYRLQRTLLPHRLWRWPSDPRNEHEHEMHVNEQSPGRLRRALEAAGFPEPSVTTGGWIYTDFVPNPRARRLYHRLASRRWTAQFGAGDIWAEAVAP